MGLEAHQAHQGLIAEQQGRQGIHALDAEQGLQPVEQDILHARDHLPLDRRALHIVQPVDDPQLMQEMEEIIQQRAFVQPVDPIDHLLAVQAPRHPRVIAASRLPTQALGQVLGDLFPCLFHRPPSSPACLSAIEKSAPQIKAFAYIGTSEFVWLRRFGTVGLTPHMCLGNRDVVWEVWANVCESAPSAALQTWG